ATAAAAPAAAADPSASAHAGDPAPGVAASVELLERCELVEVGEALEGLGLSRARRLSRYRARRLAGPSGRRPGAATLAGPEGGINWRAPGALIAPGAAAVELVQDVRQV